MKKEYGNKKTTVIALLAAVAVCLAAGLFVLLRHMGEQEAVPPVTEEAQGETEPETPEVSQPDAETPKQGGSGTGEPAESPEPESTEPEEVSSEEPEGESGDGEPEETTPETKESGQGSVPEKPQEGGQESAEPEKPKEPEAVDDPSQPPQYEAEEITPPTPQPPAGGDTNEAGKVYVPGFGYVDPPGGVVQEEAGSDGDWDKQIGDMN